MCEIVHMKNGSRLNSNCSQNQSLSRMFYRGEIDKRKEEGREEERGGKGTYQICDIFQESRERKTIWKHQSDVYKRKREGLLVIALNQDILWFEVTMDNVERVHILQCHQALLRYHFDSEEGGRSGRE